MRAAKVVLIVLLFGVGAQAGPENIIFFIGDGMGPEQVKAGGMFLYGAPGTLSFESLPFQGELTTYQFGGGTTDSAAAATALATGYKVNGGVISMAYPEYLPDYPTGAELPTLLEYYKDLGKSTGLVTTTYMTHATPAGFGAHEPARGNYSQIANDYLTQTKPNVLFGGNSYMGAADGAGYTEVSTAAALFALDPDAETMVSGQFGTGYMPYEYDGLDDLPHLSEMTAVALDILDKDADGFFLMVEGGRIDHACHANDNARNVREVAEFSASVQVALDWAAGRSDTLILVTADHETGGLNVVSNNGAGALPSVTWGGTGHTGANVPVYAWGVNAELIFGIMDNTDMPAVVKADGPVELPNPVYDAIDVTSSPDLTVQINDPDGNGEDQSVSFYGREAGFTLVALPDTQKYVLNGEDTEVFDSQTRWIERNVDSMNIVFVSHEGDITDNTDRGTPEQIAQEWADAAASMYILDGNVPYGVLPGNHDKPTTYYNTYFPYTKYEGESWYGGHYPSTGNDNNYELISAGGDDYIILHLENQPTSDVISWADGVLSANLDRKAIIVTHRYMDTSGNIPGGSLEEQIWTTLVQGNSNVFFVLCGHYGGEKLRTDSLDGGTRTVYTLLADYQNRTTVSNGGDGWLRVMRFVPGEDKVYVETYSPWLDQYETDGSSEFDLAFTMAGADFTQIGSSQVVASGATASVTWSGLAPEAKYEWYVGVDDPSSGLTSGPVMSFFTALDGDGPVVSNVAETFNTPFDNEVAISWDTDEPADSTVDYGESSGSYTGQESSSALVQVHGLVLTNLKPDKTYYYQISSSDAAGNPTTTVELSFTTSSGNHLPEANPMSVGVVENGSAAFTLSATDEDVGDVLTYSVTSPPSNGTLDTSSIPDVLYTPDPDYDGPDSFEFRAADATSWDTATVTINVTAQVQAVADTAGVDEDSSVVIDVLANDVGAPAATLSIESFGDPANGTVVDNGDDTLTYVPDADFAGPSDSFTYVVRATEPGVPGDNLDTGTVAINVTPVNDDPVAGDDNSSTDEDVAVLIDKSALLLNDTDIDVGDSLSITAVGNAVNGGIIDNGATVTFTPALNINGIGAGSFDYTVEDGNGGSDTGTVTVDIAPMNDNPVAVGDAFATNEDTPVDIAKDAFVGNDTDIDGDTPVFAGLGPATNGTVSDNGDGTVKFTPDADFAGVGSFAYDISDGNGGSDTGTVTVTVDPINDAPVADAQVVSTDNETAKAITLTASDIDDDPGVLTYSIVPASGPSNGSLTGTPPNVTYQCTTQGFEGTDSFQFVATDDDLIDSDPATVTINVTAVNHAPVASDDADTTAEDTSVVVDVLFNDNDSDGHTLDVDSVTDPANGTVVNNGTDITYTPDPDFHGIDTFTYVASDGELLSNSATVTVTVTPVNDDPVASNDSDATIEDVAVVINVLGNDSDADLDGLFVDSVTDPSNGTVINNSSNITYTPAPNYYGGDTFSYTVSDGNGGTDTATVDVTISSVNDNPVAVDDSAVTDEDTAVVIAKSVLLSNDTDVDVGDVLAISSVGNAVNGVISDTGTTVTFTPAAEYSGPASFEYTIDDGNTGSDLGLVTITVIAVDDPPVANNDAYNVDQDTVLTVDVVSGVLANDTDVDSAGLVASLGGTNVVNGVLSLSSDGSFIYTPDAGFYGADSFTYVASDATSSSPEATVAINVQQDAPPYTDDFATAEATTNGVVVGDMTLTSDGTDDTYEAISEELSGNKNFSWYLVDHQWTFNVTGGSDVAFHVEAYRDGVDEFIFSYSSDGETYTDMVTVTKTTDDDAYQTYTLPAGLTGVVYVRVVDSDTSKGEAGPADTLFIDHMSIRCAIATPEATNPSPADMAVGVDPDVVVSWTPGIGAVYHNVYFGTDLASLPLVSSQQSGTSYDPSPAGLLAENTTYYWAVDEFDGAGAPLATGAVWTFTTASACTAGTMHVESIVLETVAADKGKKLGMATVTIYDNCGNPVSDATVSGHFEGDFTDAFAELTDVNGQVVFVSAGPAIRKPTFDFVVDDVTHATLTYTGSGASASTFSE